MHFISPPSSTEELLDRARGIAGLNLGTLATRLEQTSPSNLLHAKGWIGKLLEQVLGANASSLAEPDFMDIHVELKTIPLNASGIPKETTYVCTVPLAAEIEPDWEHSWVRRKLLRVLWVPVEADPAIPIAQRRIGNSVLWSPSPAQEAILRQDWEEHMELISMGRIEEISAHHGTYLQIRPKAANKRALCLTTDAEGNPVQTLPRGFYLRTQFTTTVLQEYYAVN